MKIRRKFIEYGLEIAISISIILLELGELWGCRERWDPLAGAKSCRVIYKDEKKVYPRVTCQCAGEDKNRDFISEYYWVRYEVGDTIPGPEINK